MAQYIQVYDPKKNKLVTAGVLTNGTFIKAVNPTKHFLRLVGGYAIQSNAINQLKELSCNKIIFNTGKEIYTSSFERFLVNAKELDIGSGLQYAINLKFLAKEDKNQLKFL